MDLIYTNAKKVDQGVLPVYAFDLSFGADENNFEIVLGLDASNLEFGSFLYMEGSEYGGIVDGIKTTTEEESVTYIGRTWHGIMNSKVIRPDSGEDYFIVSGDANTIISQVINRLGLSWLFTAAEKPSGVYVSSYQFHRYCKGYDGLKAMLASVGCKLHLSWEGRFAVLNAVPIVDYTKYPVDCDSATMNCELYIHKVNHLICLGRGELAEREVIDLYVDQFGRIGSTQYYTGINEYTEIFEDTSSESFEELKAGGIEKLKELRDNDKAEIAVSEITGLSYDIGDIVGATEYKSGVSVSATVAQKIVKINNGVVKTEYKIGR